MTGKLLYKEMNYISDDMIEEALNASSLTESKKIRFTWRKWVLTAACFCTLTCSLIFLVFFQKRNLHLPDSKDILASDLLPKTTGVLAGGTGISTYFTMDAKKLSDLMKSPVKNNTDVPALKVYESVKVDDLKTYFTDKMQVINNNVKNNLGIALTEENYTEYGDNSSLRVDNLGITLTKIYDTEFKHYSSFGVDLVSDHFRINMFTSNDYGTTETRYRIWDSDNPTEALELFGDEIVITADEPEKSIKDKLSDPLAFANKVFQTDYTIQSITRNLEYSAEGNFTIYVNAYENANDINQAMYNQYLDSMSFLFMGNSKSDIKLIGIYYTKYELKPAFAEATNLLSVKDAENYLKKGYILAGHVCPACMSHNELVDLSDYDGLEIVYRTDTFGKYIIPFYAFYKQTDPYRYAITYVPAVAVGGLKEYFEAQESWHNTDK